jgi:capsular exopolysaccharide synthesis family protein
MTTLPQTSQVRLPRPAGLLPMPSQALNGHGSNGSAAGGAASSAMSAGDVWRVLRGNLWLIFAFIFAFAVAGYCVNDYLARYHSRYTAHGFVSIQEPTAFNPQTHEMVNLGQFQGLPIEQRTQSMLIKNEALFTRVLQNPGSAIRQTGWYRSFQVPVKDATGTIATVFDSVAAKQSLEDSFLAVPVDGTNLIDISMTYSNNKDARDIVAAIVDDHLSDQEDLLRTRELANGQVLNDARVREANLIKDLQDKLHERASMLNMDGIGSPDTIKFNPRDAELSSLINQKLIADANLRAINTKLKSATDAINSGQDPEGVAAMANQDPDVRVWKERVDEIDADIKSKFMELPDNPDIKRLQAIEDEDRAKMEEARSIALQTARTGLLNGLRSDAQALQTQLDGTNKEIETIQDQDNALSTARSEYTTYYDKLVAAQADLAQTNKEIEVNAAETQQTANGVQWENKPIIPDSPSFPKLGYSMAISIILGLALSVGIAFLREMMDTSVRSPRDISRIGSLTLLGMIPHEDDDPQSAGVPLPTVIYQAPTSIMAEGFRQVRTRLQHAASLDTTRSIMVTSSSPGDGKSLVASNLAAGLALNGRRILLVDSNFRKPSLDKSFAVENNVGFSDVLGSLDRFDSAVHKTQVPNLDLMPTGPRPSNPTELLESQMLLDFIERALEEYDHIIFDTGPMLLVSETAALAPRVDGVITVVRARSNSRGLLQRMRDNLRALKAEHLGVVLNAVRSQGGGYYGRNIKTYYEYQTANAN